MGQAKILNFNKFFFSKMTRPIGYVVKHSCPKGDSSTKHVRYHKSHIYNRIPQNYDFFLNWNRDGNMILEQAQQKYRMEIHEVNCRVKTSFLNVLNKYYGYVGSQDTAFNDDSMNARIRQFVKYLIEHDFELWEWE